MAAWNWLRPPTIGIRLSPSLARPAAALVDAEGRDPSRCAQDAATRAYPELRGIPLWVPFKRHRTALASAYEATAFGRRRNEMGTLDGPTGQ